MGMALDEPKDDDEIVKDNGVTYIVTKDLFDQAQPITVDFVDSVMGSGFSISSSMKFSNASSCGSSCSTC